MLNAEEAATENMSNTEEAMQLSPAWTWTEGDLRWSINWFVDWATNVHLRRALMEASDFPSDDVHEFLIVNQIAHNGAMRPSELAASLSLGRTHVSKIVKRLVDADLVTRVRAPDDERSVLIALSAEGRRIGSAILSNLDELWQQALAGWNAHDREMLRYLFSRLVADITSKGTHPSILIGHDVASDSVTPFLHRIGRLSSNHAPRGGS